MADLEEEGGCSMLNKPAQSWVQGVTHSEEEDAPHQHRDDRHEAYGIRDPPDIVQMACLIWGFVFMKTGQEHHQNHGIKPVAPALQAIACLPTDSLVKRSSWPQRLENP